MNRMNSLIILMAAAALSGCKGTEPFPDDAGVDSRYEYVEQWQEG